jgi:hypothetical protein
MKKLKSITIPGLKHTWSEIERRDIYGDTYRLMACDNPDIIRLILIDGDMCVIVRDAFEDELDEFERSAYEHERDPFSDSYYY